MTEPSAMTVMSCQMLVRFEGDEEWLQCGDPSTVLVTAGCKHEHLETVPMCPVCIVDTNHQLAYCELCDDIDGHQCLVSLLSSRPLEPVS